MKSEFTAPRRLQPLHASVLETDEFEEAFTSNALQQHAAESEMVLHAASKPEDYTISVEHVRDHFRSKGLTKSKDTVQRWCRTGDLDCQKLGLLSRYFTTETSLFALERKLLPDMIAENSGAAVVQPDAVANEAASIDMPLNAPAETPTHRDIQVDEASDAPARSDVAVNEPAPLQSIEELAKLRAENGGLREQLAEARENAKFLRDEIISARGQRGDVVKIAEQMLGTLETIAVGGRLERPQRQGSPPDQTVDPVSYTPTTSAVHHV